MMRVVQVAMIASACLVVMPNAQQTVLDQYDVSGNQPVRHTLSPALREVSGLATTKDGRVFAHGDESATISELDVSNGTVRKRFWLGAVAEKGDFEGIATAGDRFFLVTSQGMIYAAREGGPNTAVRFDRYDSGAGVACEIEGLAFDARGDRLLLPCKNALRREFRNRLIVMAVPLRTMRVQNELAVSIPFAELPTVLRRGVQPTSIEVHPRSGNWIVLSSAPAALIELDPQGRLVKAAALSGKRHAQAEGLTFTPDLTMLISDEGGKGLGTLTSYAARRIPQ
jgi:uncharacterized protein YjiK